MNNEVKDLDLDLEDIIKEILLKQIKSKAVKSAPKFKFMEILQDKSLNKLKKIAKTLGIHRYSVIKKEELIEEIYKIIINSDIIEIFLKLCNAVEFENLRKLANVDKIEDDIFIFARLEFFFSIGIVEIYFYDNKFSYVMAKEISERINKICTKKFIKEKKFECLLKDYAKSCINLYGYIHQKDFLEIFNSQNKEQIDVEQVFEILMTDAMMDGEFCFYKNYIVSRIFEEDDFESLENLIYLTKNKHKYIPDKEELLLYVNIGYFEETEHTKNLEEYLKSVCDDDTAENLAFEINLSIASETSFQDILELINTEEYDFYDNFNITTVSNLIINVQNNTRIWSNCGHTPLEISKANTQKIIHYNFNQPISVTKIGRNEPCPCGSGKKHKKCCLNK